MSTGVTPKTLSQLQRMTDAQFAEVLITMATLVIPAGGAATGFFARLARTPLGGKLIGYSSQKAGIFISALLGSIVADAINGNNPFTRRAIIGMIFELTGLELETLDKEGAKKAAGKLLADRVNEQYNTEFTTFYPPSKIVSQVKAVVHNELLQAINSQIGNYTP